MYIFTYIYLYRNRNLFIYIYHIHIVRIDDDRCFSFIWVHRFKISFREILGLWFFWGWKVYQLSIIIIIIIITEVSIATVPMENIAVPWGSRWRPAFFFGGGERGMAKGRKFQVQCEAYMILRSKETCFSAEIWHAGVLCCFIWDGW